MTGDRERFGVEIGDVVETADEENTKVSLADPVSDSMQAHVRRLRYPLGDHVGSNADSLPDVTKQRGGGLGVAHVGQDFAFRTSILSCVLLGARESFSGASMKQLSTAKVP
jgi:hypothetical protein